MDLAALSAKYGDFYAPAFFVRVDGADLMRAHLVPVSQVEVDLQLGAAGHFSFTVVDTFSFKDQSFLSGSGRPVLELLDFGTKVEISMGYGDSKGMQVMMRGMITDVSVSFSEGGSPELSISGHDNAFPLLNGTRPQTWAKRTDSAAVEDVARRYNLAVAAALTDEEHPQIEQNNEKDFQFIMKLAERNYYKVYVDDSGKQSVLCFVPPNDSGSPVVKLEWGAGLLSFSASANLAGQVGKAEIHAWDPKTADHFVGKADRGKLTDLKGNQRSAGDMLALIGGGGQPALVVRQPAFSLREAETRARAALNANEENFLCGDGESIGLPEIRPDQNLELAGLGVPFSRTYYVEQATHRVDTSGYRTRFKVKHKSIAPPGKETAR
jgi:phage protein D